MEEDSGVRALDKYFGPDIELFSFKVVNLKKENLEFFFKFISRMLVECL